MLHVDCKVKDSKTKKLALPVAHPVDSYIGLNDHPGVGQAHVALCPEQVQSIFQIPLSVAVNLEQQNRK